MLKKNIEGLERMAADYLQYKWSKFLYVEKECWKEEARWEFTSYWGACDMLGAMGVYCERNYRGKTPEDMDNPEMYSHWVKFPTDKRCEQLNFDAWKD